MRLIFGTAALAVALSLIGCDDQKRDRQRSSPSGDTRGGTDYREGRGAPPSRPSRELGTPEESPAELKAIPPPADMSAGTDLEAGKMPKDAGAAAHDAGASNLAPEPSYGPPY